MKFQKKKFSSGGDNKKFNKRKCLSSVKKKGKPAIKKKNKDTSVFNGTTAKSKKNLEEMDFDEFIEKDLEQMSDISGEDDEVLETSNGESQAEVPEISPKKKKNRVSEAAELKADLKELQDTDPEFYKFLQKEDKDALDFDLPDSDEDEGSETDHEESSGKSVTINSQLLKQWSEQMRTKDCRQCLPRVVAAFNAAVAQAEGSEEGKARTYVVRGNDVFNMVVRFCLVEMIPASAKFLKVSEAEKNLKPPRHKRWKKLRVHMKTYLTDMTKLLDTMTDNNLKLVLLKHVHQLMPYYCSLPKVAKALLKHLVTLWGSGEPSVQVLAFMCILRIVREHQNAMLDPVLRAMYMMYVKNVKFTSARTWPGINLMRRSLVELYGLDHTVAYRHSFLYIRQLAIHLRNAITDKKKDVIRTVYNWQFIHSLHFWCQLLCTLYPSDNLQPLIYPLTQVIIGTIGVVPVAKYYPLRFQCCRMLIKLSQQTKTFIPVLPFLLDVLNFTDFNKKHSKSSVRPLDFNCMLKLSAAQLTESGFRDGLIEQVYELILAYLSSQANSIGFPELVLPATLQIKNFLKTCKVGNFTRKMKQLLTKIEENSQWLEAKRKRVNFSISQFDKVVQWENMMQVEGPPICKFFENWKDVAAKKRELLKDDDNEEIPKEIEIPKVKKKKEKNVMEAKDEEMSEERNQSKEISIVTKKLGEDRVETLRLEDLSESEESDKSEDEEDSGDEESEDEESEEGKESDEELCSE